GDNHATQVVKGGTLAEPAEPVKAGSEFEGWYKEAALTSKVSFPYDVSAVTANITLYANWEGGTSGTPHIDFEKRYLHDLYTNAGAFSGTRISYAMIVYDDAGLTSITINETFSGAPPVVAKSESQTRIIPISGPGTYELYQEIRSSNLSYGEIYIAFKYTVQAYGAAYMTDYRGAFNAYNSAWAHYFVVKAPTLLYETFNLPLGGEGLPYSVNLGTAIGGAQNISYSLQSGSLPAGLTLSSDGLLCGTPETGSAGTIKFEVRAFALGWSSPIAAFTLQIKEAGSPIAAKEISGGEYHSLAIDAAGNLWAWGSNSDGQLGDGNTTSSRTPVQIKAGMKFSDISAGSSHNLAIDVNDNLWAWGDNSYGQLGDGTTTSSLSPVQIKGETKFSAISTGNSHSLAIDADGNLWAWGGNSNGQLGDGSTTNRLSPVPIKAGMKFFAVAAGDNHSLAINSEGNLWAWGNNPYGQIGDGTKTTRHSPVLIKEGTKFTAIAADYHSLAIDEDGNLWAWGQNGNGQLGDGTTSRRTLPVPIRAGTSFSQISAGWYYSSAIDTNGNLWTWGSNAYGQLGDGTTAQKTSPIQIKSGTKFIQVGAGAHHSLAIDTNGNAWVWGDNEKGQLGDGSYTSKHAPIQIYLP
ncbi:MAG: InlB B-repeat-containing protein, partial [Firmicutes bacterium]|nr:InlB B-repeat-containing protein [Bacillota bacterium]